MYSCLLTTQKLLMLGIKSYSS